MRLALDTFAGLLALAALLPASSFAQNVKVSIAGDSSVSTYKEGDVIAGWGQELKLFLDDMSSVDNQAVPGRSSKTFISEGRWDKLLAGKPDFVLIQFGHNDSHAKSQPESTDASTDFKECLRKYIDTAKAAGATPILVTPMHRRLFDKNGEPTAELAPYATAMKDVASEKNVFCVDLQASSGKLLKELGERKSAPLYRSGDLSHFSPEGAYKIASLVAEALKEDASPLKRHVRATPLPLPAGSGPKASAKGASTPSSSIHVFGVSSKVSMSFDGGSDGVVGGPAAWMTENADQRLVVNTQPATPDWVKCYFSFTPKASGQVMLIVMGGDKAEPVCYDDFDAIGATLENGGFETPGKDGVPDKWAPLSNPVYETGSGVAHSGKAFVKCSASDRLNAKFNVEAGKQVSISFWMKSAEGK